MQDDILVDWELIYTVFTLQGNSNCNQEKKQVRTIFTCMALCHGIVYKTYIQSMTPNYHTFLTNKPMGKYDNFEHVAKSYYLLTLLNQKSLTIWAHRLCYPSHLLFETKKQANCHKNKYRKQMCVCALQACKMKNMFLEDLCFGEHGVKKRPIKALEPII